MHAPGSPARSRPGRPPPTGPAFSPFPAPRGPGTPGTPRLRGQPAQEASGTPAVPRPRSPHRSIAAQLAGREQARAPTPRPAEPRRRPGAPGRWPWLRGAGSPPAPPGPAPSLPRGRGAPAPPRPGLGALTAGSPAAAASLGSRPLSPGPRARLRGEVCRRAPGHPGAAGARCSVPRGLRALGATLPGSPAARRPAGRRFQLEASVRAARRRVRVEVSEPNLSFLPIGAISNLHARSFLYRLILVWQKKIAVTSRAHSCGRLKFIAGAAVR